EVESQTRARAQHAGLDREARCRSLAMHESRLRPAADDGLVPLAITKRDGVEGPAARFVRMEHEMRPPVAGEKQRRSAALVAVTQRRVAEGLARQRAAKVANQRPDEDRGAATVGKQGVQ